MFAAQNHNHRNQIEQHPAAIGQNLLLAARNRDNCFYFKPCIVEACKKLLPTVDALEYLGAQISKKPSGFGSKAGLKLKKHSQRMHKLCTELSQPTLKDDAEQKIAVKSLWSLIKRTPLYIADATLYKLEEIGNAELQGEANPYIPVLISLAEARDGLRTAENLSLNRINFYVPSADGLLASGLFAILVAVDVGIYTSFDSMGFLDRLFSLPVGFFCGVMTLGCLGIFLSDIKGSLSESVKKISIVHPSETEDYLKQIALVSKLEHNTKKKLYGPSE